MALERLTHKGRYQLRAALRALILVRSNLRKVTAEQELFDIDATLLNKAIEDLDDPADAWKLDDAQIDELYAELRDAQKETI